MTLGGWQRLFVVLAVLWLGAVAVFGVLYWPTRTEIQGRWTSALLQDVIDSDPTLQQRYSYELRSTYTDMSDPELAAAVRAKYGFKDSDTEWTSGQMLTATRISETDKWFQAEVDELGRKRIGLAATLTAVWFVPLAILYGLGWSVGWVSRGFVHKPERR